MLLGEVDASIGLLDRAAQCFQDYRDPEAVEHSGRDLVAQRIYALHRVVGSRALVYHQSNLQN